MSASAGLALRGERPGWLGRCRVPGLRTGHCLLVSYHDTNCGVIRSFKGRTAEAVWSGQTPRRFPSNLVRPAQRKLAMLNAAVAIDSLRSPPGNRLEALKGDRRGQWSVRINEQWRVCFRWQDGHAEDVEIVDYH